MSARGSASVAGNGGFACEHKPNFLSTAKQRSQRAWPRHSLINVKNASPIKLSISPVDLMRSRELNPTWVKKGLAGAIIFDVFIWGAVSMSLSKPLTPEGRPSVSKVISACRHMLIKLIRYVSKPVSQSVSSWVSNIIRLSGPWDSICFWIQSGP